MNWCLLAAGVVGYLLGCLNGAIVISRIFKHEDVREKGSGNAGLTNFLRNYGGLTTFLVIFLDVGKVVLACCLSQLICPEMGDVARMLAGVCAMVGHMFPVFFGFRGGKGILSGAALAAVMDWRIFVILLSVFLIAFILTRYVSLGSILGAVSFGISFFAIYFQQPVIYIMALIIAALAVYMHRSNIRRLLAGEERKTYLKKSKNKE